MDLSKINDIRFLVPPTLMLFFIFLFNPSFFIKFIQLNNGNLNFFILGGITILSLGFLISSITEKFIVPIKLKNMYGKSEIDIIKKYKDFQVWKKEITDNIEHSNLYLFELINWIVLDKTNGHIKDQIHKRWNMALANFNSIIALFFSLIIGLIITAFQQSVCFWFFIWLMLLLFFIYIFYENGNKACESVLGMSRALIKYVNKNEKNVTRKNGSCE